MRFTPGAEWFSVTSWSGFGNGSGRSSTPSTTLKTAALAPMPTASVRIATLVNPGRWSRPRTTWLNRMTVDTARDGESFSTITPPHGHRHRRHPGRRPRHAPAARDQIPAERNAPRRPQTGRPVRRRGADARRHEAGAVRHRTRQGVDREPFRPERRADPDAARERQGGLARGARVRARRRAVLLHAAAPTARARTRDPM